MDAVQKDGLVLKYFKYSQTPEICMAAVKQNGMALEYVLYQTPEICMAAVKQNGDALKFVKEQPLKSKKVTNGSTSSTGLGSIRLWSRVVGI